MHRTTVSNLVFYAQSTGRVISGRQNNRTKRKCEKCTKYQTKPAQKRKCMGTSRLITNQDPEKNAVDFCEALSGAILEPSWSHFPVGEKTKRSKTSVAHAASVTPEIPNDVPCLYLARPLLPGYLDMSQ